MYAYQVLLLGVMSLMCKLCIATENSPCPTKSPCTATTSCPWYQDQLLQRSKYSRGSRNYNFIKEIVKNTICNKVEKKVCCPSSTCPSSAPCLHRSTCPWFKTLKKKRSLYPPISPEYKNITKILKESVCNKEQQQFCCKNIQTEVERPAGTQDVFESHPPGWLPSDGECGTPDESSFIVGGEETMRGAFPWAALLSRTYRDNNRTKLDWHCGGTLINNWYIVTAAHCTNNNMKYVRLGEWKVVDTSKPDLENGLYFSKKQRRRCGSCKLVSGDVDCKDGKFPEQDGSVECGPPLQDIPVDRFIRHPDYRILPNSGIAINDIALIKLKTPVTFNSLIRPVCLPVDKCEAARSLKLQNCNLQDLEGREGLAVGWGRTYKESDENVTIIPSHIQHKVSLPYASNQHCGQLYTEVFRQDVSNDLEHEQFLCAGGELGEDTCKGDSGGGMVMKSMGPQWLMGVVATGTKRCGVGLPAIFTRMDFYMDWIQQSIEE